MLEGLWVLVWLVGWLVGLKFNGTLEKVLMLLHNNVVSR
jgi:hypothetical protein